MLAKKSRYGDLKQLFEETPETTIPRLEDDMEDNLEECARNLKFGILKMRCSDNGSIEYKSGSKLLVYKL